MNYPLISEYVQSIKFSEENFDKLSNLRPVLDADSNPIMSSGNFAVVFKMEDRQSGKLYAVKCFLRDQKGRDESYRLIVSELEYLSSTFFIPMKYFEKELFVNTTQTNNTEFPILLMDWVEGLTLDKYIHKYIHDPYKLSMITYQFCRMASWLVSQEFAHGDLKPDNIIVCENGQLVLVDYDGMYVSAMKGQKARELGSVNYRHPLRSEDVFDGSIDDFSIASIALSLKAISLKPEILKTFCVEDKLLFSEKDYLDIKRSEILSKINELIDDTELLQLLGLFYIAYSKNKLSKVSCNLFNILRPDNLSVLVSDKELQDALIDESGVMYSKDGLRLLKAPDSLKNYTIKEGTKVICNSAFWYCKKLQSIKIPSTISYIGGGAFGYCENLHYINLPDSVIYIGALAFSNCNISEINIPKSVRSIYYNPFGFTTISNFRCQSDYFLVENNVLYDKDKRRLISSFNNEKHFDIPRSVQLIDEAAFAGCSSLESIIINEGLIEIGNYAFLSCSSLKKIHMPKSIKFIGNKALPKCYIYDSIARCDIRCDELEIISIPKGTNEKFRELLYSSNNGDFVKKLRERTDIYKH